VLDDVLDDKHTALGRPNMVNASTITEWAFSTKAVRIHVHEWGKQFLSRQVRGMKSKFKLTFGELNSCELGVFRS